MPFGNLQRELKTRLAHRPLRRLVLRRPGLNALVAVGEGEGAKMFRVVQRIEIVDKGVYYGVIPADDPSASVRFKAASEFRVRPQPAVQDRGSVPSRSSSDVGFSW